MNKYNGEQKVDHVDGDPYSGITKREYFAAKAMQGMLSGRTEHEDPMISVRDAVQMADDLLAELDKTTETKELVELIDKQFSSDVIEASGIEGGLRDGELQMYWEGAIWLKQQLLKRLTNDNSR